MFEDSLSSFSFRGIFLKQPGVPRGWRRRLLASRRSRSRTAAKYVPNVFGTLWSYDSLSRVWLVSIVTFLVTSISRSIMHQTVVFYGSLVNKYLMLVNKSLVIQCYTNPSKNMRIEWKIKCAENHERMSCSSSMGL